jgi:hypothetical protein
LPGKLAGNICRTAIYFSERLRDGFDFEQILAGSDDANHSPALDPSACAKACSPQLAANQHRAFRLKSRVNYGLRSQQLKLAHASFLMPRYSSDNERQPEPGKERGCQNNLPSSHARFL